MRLSPEATMTIPGVRPAPPTRVPARRLHRGRMLAVLLAAPFMAQADATIANAASPSIRVGLGASGAALELVIGVLVLGLASRWLPADDRRASRSLDVPGVAALSVAVLLLVLPLMLGQAEGWPGWAWVCMAVSVPAFAVFVSVERRAAVRGGSPLVNVTVLARPPVAWALLTLVMTTGSYYALLFTLAQYLQTGLDDSALVSGLILVPWVAAFGLAGQLARRLPARAAPMVPAAGCLLLAVAYLAISAALFAGQHGNLVLTVLLGTGGIGLGLQFSTLISHLTTTVPGDYAPDISGVATTAMQIGGALSVAAIGTLYLSLADHHPGAGPATHAYAISTVFLGAVALIAILTARLATRRTAS